MKQEYVAPNASAHIWPGTGQPAQYPWLVFLLCMFPGSCTVAWLGVVNNDVENACSSLIMKQFPVCNDKTEMKIIMALFTGPKH